MPTNITHFFPVFFINNPILNGPISSVLLWCSVTSNQHLTNVIVCVDKAGLCEVKSGGLDFEDFPSIAVIEFKEEIKITRMTERIWRKKMAKLQWSVVDLLGLMPPASCEMFIKNEGMCSFVYDTTKKCLKVLNIDRRDHYFCHVYNYPDKTPAEIIGKFCCRKCFPHFGPIAITDDVIHRFGLKSEIVLILALDVQLRQTRINNLGCNDEQLKIMDYLSEQKFISPFLLRNDPKLFSEKVVMQMYNCIWANDDFQKFLAESEPMQNYLCYRAFSKIKVAVISNYLREKAECGNITFSSSDSIHIYEDKDDEEIENAIDMIEVYGDDMEADRDASISSDIFCDLPNDALSIDFVDESFAIALPNDKKSPIKRKLEFDDEKKTRRTLMIDFAVYGYSKNVFGVCIDDYSTLKTVREKVDFEIQLRRAPDIINELDLGIRGLKATHKNYIKTLRRKLESVDAAGRNLIERNLRKMEIRDVRLLTYEEKVIWTATSHKRGIRDLREKILEGDFKYIADAIFETELGLNEFVDEWKKATTMQLARMHKYEEVFVHGDKFETEIGKKFYKLMATEIRLYRAAILKGCQQTQHAGKSLVSFIKETQDICDDNISSDFSTRAEKLKSMLQRKNFDVSGITFNDYSLYSSTRLDFTDDFASLNSTNSPAIPRRRTRTVGDSRAKPSHQNGDTDAITPVMRKTFNFPSTPKKAARVTRSNAVEQQKKKKP